MDFTRLFVDVDDCWKAFEKMYTKHLIEDGTRKRSRKSKLSTSEIMTILIAFQTSGYRTFKDFYQYILAYHRRDFPDIVSYDRFIYLIPRAIIPLLVYLQTDGIDKPTGISFIDSMLLKVCHNKRINRHRVFDGIARIGKTTMGWFYGFKLHLIINDRGGLLGCHLTAGNVDDRSVVEKMADGLFGKLFGDKGYISQSLLERLLARGVKLVTNMRANMKCRLMQLEDKILLRKRSLIETVNDTLKNVCQIEHSRHRSPINFLAHLVAGLVAYTRLPKKPSLKIEDVSYQPKNFIYLTA
jgi:CRISPR/Cas system CSM-associated protein Csm2 small subunit